MRRIPTALLAAVLLAALASIYAGCGGDDDSTVPPPPPCPISLVTPPGPDWPVPGGGTIPFFFSGDDVHIRWSPFGSGTVDVFLLAGELVGSEVGNWAVVDTIVANWVNAGYAYFEASTRDSDGEYGTSGYYGVQVNVRGNDNCADIVPMYITNTIGCVFAFTDPAPTDRDTLRAGDSYELNWVSENSSGQLDIELWRRNEAEDRQVGVIALATNDDGNYVWENLDSFNQGTQIDYYLRIADSLVEGCAAEWGPFRLEDPDICFFDVTAPQEDEIFNIGQQLTIRFNPVNSSGLVNILLYAGGRLVPGGFIADNVDAAAGEYVWTVDDFGFDEVNNLYRIVIVDAQDEYCSGRSGTFTINR